MFQDVLSPRCINSAVPFVIHFLSVRRFTVKQKGESRPDRFHGLRRIRPRKPPKAASGSGLQTAVDVPTIPDCNNEDKQLLLLNGKHHPEVTNTQA